MERPGPAAGLTCVDRPLKSLMAPLLSFQQLQTSVHDFACRGVVTLLDLPLDKIGGMLAESDADSLSHECLSGGADFNKIARLGQARPYPTACPSGGASTWAHM